MEDLISFSLRIPKALAANIEVTAKRLGMSKSEYARRAMEAFEERLMQERIAELSRQLTAHSASAALSMEGSTSDGLGHSRPSDAVRSGPSTLSLKHTGRSLAKKNGQHSSSKPTR
jgi:hypothetical protein